MKDETFKNYVLDQLRGLDELECRAMFGGYGLYRGETFFGIIHRGRLYFKTDDASRPAYVEAGMKPFRPNARQTLKSYYEVPVDVIEDEDRLLRWARPAIACRPARGGSSRRR